MTTWQEISAADADRIMSYAEEDGVRITFVVPRECAGQAVEHAFAGLGPEGVIHRRTDRGDGSITYAIRDWIDSDEDTPGLNFRPH